MSSAKIAGMRFLVHRIRMSPVDGTLVIRIIQEPAGEDIREKLSWALLIEKKCLAAIRRDQKIKNIDELKARLKSLKTLDSG